MTRARRFFHHFRSQAGFIAVLGLLTVGLTGCYTQLETVDRSAGGEPTVQKQPSSEAHTAQEPTYADEYRREYRRNAYDDGVGVSYDNGGYGHGAPYEYKYQYKYKYKYGSDYRYSGRHDRCVDAFYHDPWYYDSWCRPHHGSRFSLSLHLGSPFYYGSSFHHRPWGQRYVASGYGFGGVGYSPYSNYYVGNNFYYYGEDDDRRPDRTYRARGGTIGRTTTNAGSQGNADRQRSTARSVTRAGTSDQSVRSSSGGRIGRSPESRRSSVGRSASDRQGRRARTDRSRPDRSASGRIGRTNDRTRDRPADRSRTRRSSDDERQRSYRLPPRDRADSAGRVAPRNDRSRSGRRAAPASNDRSKAGSSRDRSRSRSGSARSSRDRSGSDSSGRSSRSDRSRSNNDDDDDGS